MTPERWKQVKSVLDAALDRDAAARADMLDEACAGDPSLREEVEALLAAHREGAPFFTEPLVLAHPEETTDQRIGPYRVVRKISQGGMGTVYLAERADEQYQRQVALKVIRRGFDTDDRIQRFLAERQILASLSHPHIARLYDGGVTEDGRPYFAMEYVEGQPIDQYCDDERLAVEERLALFVTVVEAVHHAHQNLVVHRDLKPANILVTQEGTVKLLDFGIAKLLDEQASHRRPLTRTGERLMTPEYASPEQVTSNAITTASDVYQLGMLLYELLAGRHPYAAASRTPHEIEQRILKEAPTRPSTVVTRAAGSSAQAPEAISQARRTEPKALRKKLKGDLDAVVLKALRKEPEQRYASAGALADDLKRYLDGLTVTARKGTWRYRLRTFTRRHRWGVGTAAVFLVLLMTYAVTVTMQARRITQERDKAEQVASFLTNLLEMSDPEKGEGSTVTTRQILDQGAARVEDELANQPAVQARLMNVIGSAYRGHGLYEKALELHQRALTLNRRHFGTDSREVADTQNNIGEVLYYLGRYDEAKAYYRRSLATRRRQLSLQHVDIAQSLNNLALINLARGNYGQAESRQRQAVAIFKSQLGEDHWRIANAMNNLGRVLSEQGKYDEAAPLFRQALAMHQRLRGGRRNNVALAITRNNFGMVLREQGRPEAAEQAHRQALATFRSVLKSDHPFVGKALLRLAEALDRQDRLSEAEHTYRQALAHQRRALPEEDPRQADPLLELGALLLKTERAEKAEPLLREAAELRQRGLPEGHWQIAEAQSELGACLTALERYDEAAPLLTGSYAALKTTRGLQDSHTRVARDRLRALHKVQGLPKKTAAYQQK